MGAGWEEWGGARSAPDPEGAVGRGGNEERVGGVEADALDRVLVAAAGPELLREVVGRVAAEEAVVGRADDARRAAVEADLVARVLAHLDRADLRDRAHVPQLDRAVGVARGDDVAAVVDGDRVARVGVAVERLGAEVGSDIPDGDGLVSCSGGKVA